MKKRLCIFLTVFAVMSMLLGISVYAVETRYAYTTSATSTLNILNGTAYCSSTAKGNSIVKQIDGIQYLEKKNGSKWEVVSNGTWSDSAKSNFLPMNNSKDNLTSGTYRVRTVFTVYSENNSEKAEPLSKEVTI